MAGFAACFKRNLVTLQSVSTLRNWDAAENLLRTFPYIGNDVVRQSYKLANCLNLNFFSTGYSSVHGEKPSAEYAKFRKESLESEFGNVLGTRSKSISYLYDFSPFWALYRASIVSYHVLKLAVWRIFVHDMKKRSIMFRNTLIHLGPFYVKLGQALSTRPDILPTVYCQELAKLQDQIPPFPTHVAMRSIESELGAPVSHFFADISDEPIAAASLGQVYKAHLHSGELVAVKVQRPGMSHRLTLDALLFHMIGGQLKRFAKARKDLLVAVNEMVRHMFEEIDYILEAQNAERFASLYADYVCEDNENPKAQHTVAKRKPSIIKVPRIYWRLTRKAVLTMEWVDGIKLTDELRLRNACLNRKELIHQGLYCSLRQLLEVGFFHADPHPGNLVATHEGSLAYFDFGMMGDIPRHYRIGLIKILVHFVNRDSLGLANDFLSLGFLPEGVDIHAVSDALKASFGDGTRQSQDFQSIMDQLYSVMYEFNFSLPPDYALVIRALGSLEGTAKVLDPNFKVVESAYPFVIGRLLADPNPDMRKILQELLIHNDGSIRWTRLEKLITAISQQSSGSNNSSSVPDGASSSSLEWNSFDMRAVAAATEDLFHFILSNKGFRVRVFLLKDIIKAAGIFLEGEILMNGDEKPETRGKLNNEGHAMLMRVVKGFQSLRTAVSLAPDVWAAMLIRVAVKPEFQKFGFDVICALIEHFRYRIPEAIWIRISRFIRNADEKCTTEDT